MASDTANGALRFARRALVLVVVTLLATLVLRQVLVHLLDIPLEARWFHRDALGNLAFASCCSGH